jgi:hypothetical protein
VAAAQTEGELMQTRRSRYVIIGCAAAVVFGIGQANAAAQAGEPIEVGAQLVVAGISELDSSDVGIGGHVTWFPWKWVGAEAELNYFPSALPNDPVEVTANRLEGLFGVVIGPRRGVWRPTARIRPGFLQVASAQQVAVCILIYPPPASCALTAGETLFALEFGAGVEFYMPGRTFVRLDVGDRMLKYQGPAIDNEHRVHDGDYYRHDFRLAVGGGWRF